MDTEREPTADSMAVFHGAWYRLALLVFAGFLTLWWIGQGPGNASYGVALAWATSSLEPALPFSVIRLVPRQWLIVPAGERHLHRLMGVGLFARLLGIIGWNHVIGSIRRFPGTRAGLLSLQEHACFGLVAHGLCLAIHLVLAVLALLTSRPWSGMFWILCPAVVVHLYPMLLQRFTLLRLQPILEKMGALEGRTGFPHRFEFE